MAIHRGIQSAVFYYLSCAPCAEARYRKQRKEDRERGRLERELLEAENPNLYRQPSPASTNPHWHSEIALGPTLAYRGRRKNNADGRARRAAGATVESTSPGRSYVDLPKQAVDDDADDSRWNFRVYQREDEELWGSASNVDTASSYAGSLAKPQRALTRDSASTSYNNFRNPPVNDLHPATVTKIGSREEVMWMLQPPPAAEVMRGKERVSRSRSDSGESRLMNSSSVSLARQLSARVVQNRLRTLETSPPISHESSSPNGNVPYGQRHDQSATISQRDFALEPASVEASNVSRSSPVLFAEDSTWTKGAAQQRLLTPEAAGSKSYAARPQLSAIPSSREVIPIVERSDNVLDAQKVKENDIPSKRRNDEEASNDAARLGLQFPYVIRETSVKVAGDTTPINLNGKVIRTHMKSGRNETHHQASGHRHEPSDDLMLIKPELLDSWYASDFELGKWVHETTKREVKQRWSMDL